ncbi:hypothetical protein L210DRAFT_961246 [Boletus edulis BED1]|uniref:Uncharacterized protein n=1 Tax=Boletus edulis BED1 TaxID=1328754 RepID=A0AAD4GA98_BOLED|nr:hypothetical protein L210DRAFT_961246 [Boletus edulis BED1]
MYRKIGRNIKIVAINLYKHDHLSLANILNCLEISKRMFWHICKLWMETGDVVHHNHGIPDINYLLCLVNHHPDWFLNELVDLLHHNCFIAVHFTTLYCELSRARISLKKLRKIAKERDALYHTDFI